MKTHVDFTLRYIVIIATSWLIGLMSMSTLSQEVGNDAEMAETRLRPGDNLILVLPGESSLNQEIQINRSGRLLVPEAGEVEIAGLTIRQAQQKIKRLLADVIHDLSNFEIVIKQRRLIISVLGYVEKPGAVDLPNEAGIQQALVAAGGLVEGAQLNRMQVRRKGQVIRFDYKHYLDSGDSSKLPVLEPLDTIFVPASSLLGNVQTKFDPKAVSTTTDGGDSETILLFGEVSQPGAINWTAQLNLFDLIALAGGPNTKADLSKVKILSKTADNQVEHQLFNLAKFMSTGGDLTKVPVLKPFDMVIIPQKSDIDYQYEAQWLNQSIENSIYLMGQFNAPGRYKVNDDMHFLDILAAARGPNDKADIHNIRITHRENDRTHVTYLDLGEYFETGNDILLPKVNAGDVIYIPDIGRSWLNQSTSSTVRVLGAVGMQGRYQFNQTMTILDLLAEAGGLTPSAESSGIIVVNSQCCGESQVETFNLLAFSKSGNLTELPKIHPGDTVYVMHKNDSTWNRVIEGIQETVSVISVLKILGGG